MNLRVFVLIFCTGLWGLGFVGTRWTFLKYDPFWSNTIRFAIAALFCSPILFIKRPFSVYKKSFISSLLLWGGLQVQTYGIAHTTMAKSGFLTVFYAIFTPLLAMFIYKKKYPWSYWLLLLLAFVGIAFLCELQWSNLNTGDYLILCSAFLFALHILYIDKIAKEFSPIELNFLQCVFVGLFGISVGVLFFPIPDLSPLFDWSSLFTASPLAGFFILSILSSIFAFTIQIYAQQGVEPHIVSLVFLLESVFATIFGFIFFSETLSFYGYLGCVLVFISIALLGVVLRKRKGT